MPRRTSRRHSRRLRPNSRRRSSRRLRANAVAASVWMMNEGLPNQIGVFRLFSVNDNKRYALYFAPNTLENGMKVRRSQAYAENVKVLQWPTVEEIASPRNRIRRKPGSVPFVPAMLEPPRWYGLGVKVYENGLVEYLLSPENSVGKNIALMRRRFSEPLDARDSLEELNPREFLKQFDGKHKTFSE